MSWTEREPSSNRLAQLTAARDARYCLLRQDCRFEAYKALHVYGVDPEAVTRGRLAPPPLEPVRVTLSAYGTEPSDLLDKPCLILSTRARAALEQVGATNIEYHAVELQLEYAEASIGGYWLANVIGLVSCVDRERSHWEGGDPEEGRLLQFEIDVARTYDFAMFRLAEEPRLVVVSARVRQALERAGLRGLVFQAPGSYNGYPVDSSRSAPDSQDEPS